MSFEDTRLETVYARLRIDDLPYRELGSIFGLVAVWSLVSAFTAVPAPPAVGRAAAAELATGAFWGTAALSATRVWISYGFAVAVGVTLGVAVGWSDVVEDLVYPALEVLRPIPPIAWVPFGILVIPENLVVVPVIERNLNLSIVFVTFLGGFFPVLLNTVDGVQDLDTEYVDAARSLGTDRLQTLRHVVLPGALPSIHTGMVNGIGLAWVNLVAAEMLRSGLGKRVWVAYREGAYAEIVVGMAAIGVLGYLSATVVRVAGERVIPWTAAERT